MNLGRILAVGGMVAGLLGCAGTGDLEASDADRQESSFTSNQATLLTFEFDGEVTTSSSWASPTQTINDQLLYTIGELNGSRGVGRLDALKLTNVTSARQADGSTKIAYHAVLPVGWGSTTNLPSTYELVLPRRADSTAQAAFTTKYKAGCVDHGAHEVDSGSMWYYYRPANSACKLAPEDVVRFTATVTKSPENTSGKYPEYHQVWSDDALKVVAIFGKYENGKTTSADAGIAGYNNFVASVRKALPGATTSPPSVASSPGVESPDVTISSKLADGRTVQVTALLIDSVTSVTAAFDARYSALSTDADVIFYNGHAGLGQNVRALARKGRFVPGKYQIFFMNGCDTFAYVDGSLAQTRALLNPDDPTGTKYMEIVTNLQPAFFSSMPAASMALIQGLMSYDAPKTYQEIFDGIDDNQIVVVTGEEDNVFTPGMTDPKPEPEAWEGIDEAAYVMKGAQLMFETPELPAGRYEIAMREDASHPGGDADLYVAVGRTATLSDWDYRPYETGSNETVVVELEKAAKISIMVDGYEDMEADQAAFVLTARAL